MVNVVALIWFAATLNATVQNNRINIISNAEAVEENHIKNAEQDICLKALDKDVEYIIKILEKIDRKI